MYNPRSIVLLLFARNLMLPSVRTNKTLGHTGKERTAEHRTGLPVIPVIARASRPVY